MQHAVSIRGAAECWMFLGLESVPGFGHCCPVFVVRGCCQAGGATELVIYTDQVSELAPGQLLPVALQEWDASITSCQTKLCFLAQLLSLLTCLRSAQFKVWLPPCCLLCPPAGTCFVAQGRGFNLWPGSTCTLTNKQKACFIMLSGGE